jgi:tRNA (guanine10-N2)-dimethyltransferase
VRLLFEASGEHPTLPGAEIAAALEAVTGRKAALSKDGSSVFASCPRRAVKAVSARLALCHSISEVISEHSSVRAALKSKELASVEGESVKVRAVIASGAWTKLQQLAAERSVGAVLAKRNRIDLRTPEAEVRVVLGKKVSLCMLIHNVDRAGFEARRGENRPFFSPISLHPKYARALVNLSGVRPSARLLDPFCGTGGILIEAALAGADALGSDLDPRMVEGSRENLEQFGLSARLERCDIAEISDIFGNVSAIATDPPYGRASSTGREETGSLYARMLDAFAESLPNGGRAAVVLPDMAVVKKLPRGLRLQESHALRVHRSLVRHFVVLRKV